MVSGGWALAYRQYSKAYVNKETVAKAERRGGWRGDFVAPWDWRRGERLEGATRTKGRVISRDNVRPTVRSSGGCRIKGNVNYNSSKRICHVPSGRYYEQTRISPSKGERWFCTEAEAQAAGWRRARR